MLKFKKLKKRTVIPLNIEELNKVDEKIKSLNQQLQPFGEHHYLPLISDAVYFVADPEHLETKALEKKYQELRGRISANLSFGFICLRVREFCGSDATNCPAGNSD